MNKPRTLALIGVVVLLFVVYGTITALMQSANTPPVMSNAGDITSVIHTSWALLGPDPVSRLTAYHDTNWDKQPNNPAYPDCYKPLPTERLLLGSNIVDLAS